MNKLLDEKTADMKSAWIGWAWVLPQVLLGFLNWHAWILVRGDMSPFQYSRALHIGIFEAAILASGCVAWLIQTLRRKPIGLGLALAAIAMHTGYLWLFLQSIDRLLPGTVTLWMLPDTELIFYQFSLMMPVIFLMLVRLARIRLGLSTPVDVGLSLAAIVLIPSGAMVIGSLLVRLERLISWHESFQYLLIAAMVAGTAFILVAFLRLMIKLHDLVQRRSWSEWAIPLAAGLAAPLAGLSLNATIPFPYDFQDASVYLLTVLNATALLIPFRPGSRWAGPGWAARAALYPFTVYFFLVFLPFLPLSLLAMIAAGAGFLILAPLFLFVVHTRRLWEQGRVLATQYGTIRLVAMFAACILILPAAFMLRNELDRQTLNHAVDSVFNPDFTSTRLSVNTTQLNRALDRMDDMKHGIYLPYLSDIYDTMVFHGMVLPDEKAQLIRQSLLGNTPVAKSRSGIFGDGFFGTRSRSTRRVRGGGVSHGVVVASHEMECHQTNGVTETEIRLVLENRGGGNGEFSDRITVPEGVLVTGFWLDVNGTNKTAQLRERKTATWIYEMIRDMTRRDPGLVVYEDNRHLHLRVFPFAAGEKRRCGLRLRFPTTLQPSLCCAGSTITLTDSPEPSRAVCAALAKGQMALAVPASAISNWPTFHREVVAHLILDQSASANTNRADVIDRARAALNTLPPSISRIRLTWANYEQEDMPAESLSREEALRALEHIPALPCRGGFCAERVITRVLLSESAGTHRPEPAGYATLFVVIPAPGSIPVHAGSLAPFVRLTPDLPAYMVFDDNRLYCVPFHTSIKGPCKPTDLSPSNIVVIRNGSTTALLAAGQDAVVFAPVSQQPDWQVWNPSSGQFGKLADAVPCTDPAYVAGLSLWSRHQTLAWTPGKMDAALPDLVKDARTAGVLTPEAAFIVVETKSQEVMLSRKERQSLDANHALEFDEAGTQKAPAPSVLWFVFPALWLLWRMKGKSHFQEVK